MRTRAKPVAIATTVFLLEILGFTRMLYGKLGNSRQSSEFSFDS
jgi:hypothetical protein